MSRPERSPNPSCPLGGSTGPRPKGGGGEGGADDERSGPAADALRPAARRARGSAQQAEAPGHAAGEDGPAAR